MTRDDGIRGMVPRGVVTLCCSCQRFRFRTDHGPMSYSVSAWAATVGNMRRNSGGLGSVSCCSAFPLVDVLARQAGAP